MHYRNVFFKSVVRPILLRNKVLAPSLAELSKVSGPSETEAQKVLGRMISQKLDIQNFLTEFENLHGKLVLRMQETEMNFSENHNIANSSALLIYLIVRVFRPKIILETGVANGASTYYVINALSENKIGQLYSVDISSDVGRLLTPEEKVGWQLKVISEKNAFRDFSKIVSELPQIDFFIHDSDHTYDGQMSEYQIAYPKIPKGGILASDDVDLSYAFLNFASSVSAKPVCLVSADKVFGAFIKN